MPIYEYICEDCNHHFDSLRSMSEADSPIACTMCNSQQTTRQLSTFFAQNGDGLNILPSNNQGCASCRGRSCATCG